MAIFTIQLALGSLELNDKVVQFLRVTRLLDRVGHAARYRVRQPTWRTNPASGAISVSSATLRATIRLRERDDHSPSEPGSARIWPMLACSGDVTNVTR